MSDFLLCIKALVDCPASIKDPVLLQEHMDVVPEGLLQEYESIISINKSKFEPFPIEEDKILLLEHDIVSSKVSEGYFMFCHCKSYSSSFIQHDSTTVNVIQGLKS